MKLLLTTCLLPVTAFVSHPQFLTNHNSCPFARLLKAGNKDKYNEDTVLNY